MSSIDTYGLINAKVRTMRSYFLTEAQYRQLVESKSLREFWALLSQTRYAPLVEKVNYQEPVQVEQSFLLAEIQQLNQIKKYSHKRTSDVLNRLMERYDGEKLKIILRSWFRQGKGSNEILPDRILYDFPIQAMVQAKDIHEIIFLLEGTPFQKVLYEARQNYIETRSLFPLELAIDRRIYQRLLDIKSFINRRDRRIVERLIGVEIDLKNLEWIGRFKKYYQLSSAQIADYLLPHGYRLGKEQIRQSLGGDSITKILLQIMRGMNADLPAEMEGELALKALDLFLKEVLMREARRAFGEFPFSIGSVLGYFYLMRLEMQNLRMMVQAKQYNLPPADIDGMLFY
ncbi:V-type ATPase subunit [bacterium]|nr:V-type ATPase subunit [bacterium]